MVEDLWDSVVQSPWSPDLSGLRLSFMLALCISLCFDCCWVFLWWVLPSSWLTEGYSTHHVVYAVVQVLKPGLRILHSTQTAVTCTLFFFLLYQMGIFSWFLLLIFHCWCTKMILISEYWLCIPLFCQIHLLGWAVFFVESYRVFDIHSRVICEQ